MNFGFFAYSRSWKVYWSRCESSWCLYDLKVGLVSNVESNVEPGRKPLKDGAVLTDHELPEVPVFFVKGEFMFLLEAESQVRQSLATWYPADLGEYPVAAPKGVGSIDVFADDLEGKADWD